MLYYLMVRYASLTHPTTTADQLHRYTAALREHRCDRHWQLRKIQQCDRSSGEPRS